MSKHTDLIRLAGFSISLAALLFTASNLTPRTALEARQSEQQTHAATRKDLPRLGPEAVAPTTPVAVKTTQLKRGETLSDVFTRLGATGGEAHQAITSLTTQKLVDPRRVQRGQELTLYFEHDTLLAVELPLEPGRRALAKRLDDTTFRATEMRSRLRPEYVSVSGKIVTSLYENARSAGVEDQKIVDFAGIFAFDLDFQREIHPGDAFEMVFESLQDERGQTIRSGALVFAALDGLDAKKSYYRFTPTDDGETDYFQANGESATRFLMKTPVNGARLSSRFGKRRHPISGYTRLHKGTDFAAPTGTPIYAAGNGTVERASRYGGYGHYIRIRHANGYKTAYAHLSRYARGLKRGTKVRQGQTIGYVGSTGASTGPHLHYEVYQNGRPLDVMRLNLPTGRKLAETPGMMAEFETARMAIDTLRKPHSSEVKAATFNAEAQAAPAP